MFLPAMPMRSHWCSIAAIHELEKSPTNVRRRRMLSTFVVSLHSSGSSRVPTDHRMSVLFHRTFGLEPQLAAGGVDVGSLALADGDGNPSLFEDGDELLSAWGGRFVER